MARWYLVGVVVAVLVLGGWVMAQREGADPKIPAAQGSFMVAPAGNSAILLDTRTGKSWALHRSVRGDSVWLPAMRVDSEEDARRWKEAEERLREQLGKRENP
jgi:hypothetical protein